MAQAPVDKWTRALGPAYVRSGNKVTALVDGAETFRAIHDAIATADAAGFVYILAWWLDVDLQLVQGDVNSTLRSLLTRAPRGFKVRAMVWKQPGSSDKTNEAAVEFINGLPGGQAVLDNRTWSIVASHHQKVIVVRARDGLVGFCGGLDLNLDRILGGGPNLDVDKQLGISPTGPLHDVHCKIEGPAAYDLVNVFKQRWFGYGSSYAGMELDRHVGETAKAPPRQGDQYVRIARTFNYVGARGSCQASRSVRTTLTNAIRAARRFIYIEDQYMVNREAARLLAGRLEELQHVTILVTHPAISDFPAIEDWQARFVNELRSNPTSAHKARVFVRTSRVSPPLGPHTYVHAKMWIVDDELAVIGSANLDVRGWSGDSQANACVFDGPASDKSPPFAQRLRMRLWSEHLQVPESMLADGVASAGLWTDRTRSPNANVAPWGEPLEGLESLPWKHLASTALGSAAPRYVDLSADDLKVCAPETPRAPGDPPDLGLW